MPYHGNLYYVEWLGSGPTIMLLHGLTGRGALWEEVGRGLSKAGYHAIAPDLRGHGASHQPGSYHLTDFAADVTELLLYTGRCHLVGHSLGAAVGWTIARDRPDLVASLVIEDQHPDKKTRIWEGWQEWAGAWPGDFASHEEGLAFLQEAGRNAAWWAPSLVQKSTGRWGWAFDLQAVVAASRSLSEIDSWDTLEQITAPTLLIRGGASLHLRADVAKRMAATIKRSQLVTVQGADHWVHRDAPPYVALLTNFYAQLANNIV